MDREGPEERKPGQVNDRESRFEPPAAGYEPGMDAVAGQTSHRVGEVLAQAEADAAAIREEAERGAEVIVNAAHAEATGVAQGAHGAAQAAARERAARLAELRASIAARCVSLTEGLEGGELTRLRLEQLVGILGEAEERILNEVAAGPGGERGVEPALMTAPPVPNAPPPAAENWMPAPGGELPEGAPMMRMPARSGDRVSDARFDAVLMAIQGGERQDVEHRLSNEYGSNGWEELLDELFGHADVRA